MAKYRFLTADLLTDTTLEEMPFGGVSYGDVLGAPGSFSGTLPLSLKRTYSSVKAYATTVRSDAPNGYWRLGEASGTTAADETGNALTGTYTGAFTLGSTGLITGDANTALALAGAGYVTIADNALIRPGLGNFSTEVIFKRNGNPGASEFLLNKSTATIDGYEIFLSTSGFVTARIGAIMLQNAVSLCDNVAHHVLVSFTRDANAVMYVDGVAAVTSDISTEVARNLNGSGALEIGRRSAGNNFTGTIDDVAYYPKAVAPTRVLAHSNSASGTKETSKFSVDVVKRSNLEPSKTALYVERDGVLVWGGIIWTVAADDGANTVTVGAEGFWSYFRRRLIRLTKTYVAQDQLAIVRDLVNYAQGILYGDIGVVVGSETSGVLRDRTYNSFERTNLGQAVEDLSAVENGFDFAIGVDYVSGVRTKTLRLYYPKRGARSTHVIDLGTNIESLGFAIDGTKQANLIDAIGAGEGLKMLISTAADTTLLGSYPLLEDTVAYKDVTVSATLAAHARSVMAQTRIPVESLPTLVVRPTVDLNIGSFGVGDEVEIRTQNAGGFLALDSIYRATAWTATLEDDGKEAIAMSFAPTEAFV